MAHWPSSLLSDHIHPWGWEGLLATCGLLLGLRAILGVRDRAELRHPSVLLLLHMLTVFVRAMFAPESRMQSTLHLASLFLLFACVGVSLLVLVHWLLQRRFRTELPRILRDVLQGMVYAAAGFLTLRAAGVEPTSLLTTSALLTAVIGLSLQDTLGNLFAGLAIQAERPFEIGDWVQFDDKREHIGRIVEINWRAAKVLTIEHVEVTVPNSMLAKAPLRNYSKPDPHVRVSISVPAPYELPPGRVQELLLSLARDVPGVAEHPAAFAVVTGFSERGVEYDLRYFIGDFSQREIIAGAIRERFWYALDREAVSFPVPRRAVSLQRESELREARKLDLRALEAALRGVDFLHALPVEVLRELAARSRTLRFAPGEWILRQGEEGSSLHIVLEGSVRVMIASDGQEPIEVAQLGVGQVFGEMSVMTGEPRSASVCADTETVLLELCKDAVRDVVDKTPELMQAMGDVLAQRMAMVEEAREAGSSQNVATAEDSRELLQRIKRFFSN